MEAIALRKSFENLGLQLLFADVGFLFGLKPHQTLSSEERPALIDLYNFIKSASTGLDLFSMRRQKKGEKGYASLITLGLDKSIEAERAFLAMQPILPDDPAQAKAELKELNHTCKKILSGKRGFNGERKKVHSFCRKFLSHLHQERLENLKNPSNLWP